MTLREEIQAKINAIDAKASAEMAELRVHLADGGNWLDLEFEALKAKLEEVVAKVRAAL